MAERLCNGFLIRIGNDNVGSTPTARTILKMYNNRIDYRDCKTCLGLNRSCDKSPARPKDKKHDVLYLCKCGRRWWFYNDFWHLWKHVREDEEWSALKRWPWCREFVDEIECETIAVELDKDELT